MKKASIKDVAKLAEVSTATVSHVLNNSRRVSDNTAKKVLDAVTELQYSPNIAARGFRTGKSNTIGFLAPDINNKFFFVLIDSIEAALTESGYHLIIANTNETKDREFEHLRYFASGATDGVIIASTTGSCDELPKEIMGHFPAVFVDRKPKNMIYDCLTISNQQAVYQAVSHLFCLGCRRMGFITGLPRLSTSIERRQAFVNAVKAHGLALDSVQIQAGNSMHLSAYICAENLLKAKCDAIIVGNGVMTFDTLVYLKGSNLPGANQVKVVGFDDGYESMAKLFDVNWIVQPVQELGTRAAKQILARIEHPTSPIREIVLSGVYSHNTK